MHSSRLCLTHTFAANSQQPMVYVEDDSTSFSFKQFETDELKVLTEKE